jgi:hypothetical protein
LASLSLEDYVKLVKSNLRFFGYSEINHAVSLDFRSAGMKISTFIKSSKFPLRYNSYVILLEEELSFEDLIPTVSMVEEVIGRDRVGIIAFAEVRPPSALRIAQLRKGAGHVLLLVNLKEMRVFVITEGKIVDDPFKFGYGIASGFYQLLLIKRERVEKERSEA